MTEIPAYPTAARQLLRDTLVDAARAQLAERPWAGVTMAAVARAAGVSRQTLYNEFRSRDEFARAIVLREVGRFLVDVEETILARLDDPDAALEAALDVFLTAAADDPVVRSVLLDRDGDGLLPYITTQGQPVVETAASRIAAIVVEGWPQVAEDDAALLADALVRLAISYAALPAESPHTTAAAVTRLLAPYLRRILGEPS